MDGTLGGILPCKRNNRLAIFPGQPKSSLVWRFGHIQHGLLYLVKFNISNWLSIQGPDIILIQFFTEICPQTGFISNIPAVSPLGHILSQLFYKGFFH